jgi:prepilin-type N-terminal cleavage/methylation domain-containing protein
MSNDSRVKPRRERGFSLIEMLVVVAIIAIMVTVSLPAIGQYMRNYHIRGAAQQFAGELQAARSKAIATNSNAVSLVVVDFDSYRIVQEDLAVAEARSTLRDLPSGVRFVVATAANSGPSIRFNRLGGFCNPAAGLPCAPAFANPCGAEAARCTTDSGANFFAPQADGTLVVTLREPNTNVQRTVRIAPGGRVLPQP